MQKLLEAPDSKPLGFDAIIETRPQKENVLGLWKRLEMGLLPLADGEEALRSLDEVSMDAHEAFVLAEVARLEREAANDAYIVALNEARNAHTAEGVKGAFSEAWGHARILLNDRHLVERLRKAETVRAELKDLTERLQQRELSLRVIVRILAEREDSERGADRAARRSGSRDGAE